MVYLCILLQIGVLINLLKFGHYVEVFVLNHSDFWLFKFNTFLLLGIWMSPSYLIMLELLENQFIPNFYTYKTPGSLKRGFRYDGLFEDVWLWSLHKFPTIIIEVDIIVFSLCLIHKWLIPLFNYLTLYIFMKLLHVISNIVCR